MCSNKELKVIMCAFNVIMPLNIGFAQNNIPVEPKMDTAIVQEKKSDEKININQSEILLMFDRSRLTLEEERFLAEKDEIMSSDMEKQEKEIKIATLKEKMLGNKKR
ncbi:MAG: hypothetical protein JXA18_13760 [Chitinispirillaceae bacterium]|nr:hypothetical protein [Chitinispirillaceae bacterium]